MFRRFFVFLVALLQGACSLIVDTTGFAAGEVLANAGADLVVAPSSVVSLDAGESTQANGRALRFRWEQISGPTVEMTTDGAVATFEAPDTTTTLEFTVHVSAGGSDEVADSVVVVVDNAPTAIVAPVVDTMTVRTAYLDASKSFDVDDEALTFRWTQTSGPTVALEGTDAPIATFATSTNKSTLGFRVDVCDSAGACASAETTVHVHRWSKIAAGGVTALALRSDGTVWAWGADPYGSLGVGDARGGSAAPGPVRVRGVSGATAIWAGRGGASFAEANGTIVSWGANCQGEGGLPASVDCERPRLAEPVDAAHQGGLAFATIERNGLFVASDGALTGVGSNLHGELGTCDLTTPTTISGTWADVALAQWQGYFAGGRTSEGVLYVWGSNTFGIRGNGTAVDECIAPTSPLIGVSDFDLGEVHVAAIRNGNIYSWGFGEGTSLVTQRGSSGQFSRVAVGSRHSLAVKRNGALHSWGANARGALGTGDLVDVVPIGNDEPPRLGTDSDWSEVAADRENSIALRTDGTLWTWGATGAMLANGYGTTEHRLTPGRAADAPGRCGDGIVASGRTDEAEFRQVDEVCDDGPLNGSPGRCAATCTCASARVVYVDASATGANDGTTWANAFQTIQPSIAASSACDVVWVAEGTYTAPEASPSLPVATMGLRTELYGGFAGHETHFAQRDPRRHPTVLDGADASRHVVVGAPNGVLDGFIVRHGRASGGSAADASGGGLFLPFDTADSFIVRNVTFESNHADEIGGAIHASGSDGAPYPLLIVEDSRFVSNSARSGGAIGFGGCVLRAKDVVFVDNHAAAVAGIRRGGAIYESGNGSTTVTFATFVANEAQDAGSAIYATSSARQVRFVSAVDHVGPGAVFHFQDIEQFLPTLLASVLWNPLAGSEVFQGNIGASCFAGAPVGPTVPNVVIGVSPFVIVGSGIETRPYLAPESPCRDSPSSPGARYATGWDERTTTSDGAVDASPIDLGMHWTR